MSLFGRKGGRAAAPPEPAPGPLERAAEEFIRTFHAEDRRAGPPEPRLRRVRAEIDATGTYRHTPAELAYGARVAWRNSSRCIGRLYWRGLRVRDLRHARTADEVAAGCVEHLAAATGAGRIRPVITVFAPDEPGRPGPRLWNEQLIRYAGYRRPDGGVTGDPRNAALTDAARALGWPGGPGTPFDPLPLVVAAPGEPVRWYGLPREVVLEVPLEHPDFPWFADLGLRWHAVPAVSDMTLEIGGVGYPAAPFNGWYMGTEIGARNLADADRYDMLPAVAERLGLDTGDEASLWRDRALVELNVAVLHSFRAAGVAITDHHTESRRFLAHLAREEAAGRRCPADWSWIVPPLSGSATPVFHRYYDQAELTPAFVRRPPAWSAGAPADQAPGACPVAQPAASATSTASAIVCS
ncbi:nitric oxide synthase oxygenase [Spirillospora sp. NPDC127200]